MGNLSVAISGLGNSGSNYHAPSYEQNSSANIVAVCDKDDDRCEKQANKYGVIGYNSFNNMIEENDIDLVSICTPPTYHFEQAKFAIENGVNALIEKPLTTNLNDAIKLKNIDENNSSDIIVVHNRKMKPEFRHAFDLIGRGKIGKVTDIHYFKSIKRSDRTLSPNHWANDLSGGGWEERLPHPLYIINNIGGDLEILSVSSMRKEKSSKIPNDVFILLKGDCFATIRYSATIDSSVPNYYIIQGTNGKLRISYKGAEYLPTRNGIKDDVFHGIHVMYKTGKYFITSIKKKFGQNSTIKSESHRMYIDSTLDYICGEGPKPTSWEEALYTVEATEKIGCKISEGN